MLPILPAFTVVTTADCCFTCMQLLSCSTAASGQSAGYQTACLHQRMVQYTLLPLYSTAGSKPHPTQPRPFQLQTEVRGALHQDEMAAKLAAEQARAKRLRRVTARPLPVTVDVPAMPPKPEPKPLTLPDPFELKSLVSRAVGLYFNPHLPALLLYHPAVGA